MAKKRGVLAGINHRAKVAAIEQQKREIARERKHTAAVRKHEQAQRAEQQALAQIEKADAAERKQLEKLAKEAHIASMNAEVDALNAELVDRLEEFERLLSSTLDVDDFVDLEALKQEAVHPPFERPDLEPQPLPPLAPPPPAPVFVPPTGLSGLLGKKRQEQAQERAQDSFEAATHEWQFLLDALAARRAVVEAEHHRTEAERGEVRGAAHAKYLEECESREAEVSEENRSVDLLIANLGYGVAEAVEEYVSIVVANSVYPDVFEVSHDFSFVADHAELAMHAIVPEPASMPTVKSYKYTKASDEITSTNLSQKAQKDLYASAIHQVALRSIHEVFEADRRGLIRTIALQVGTETVHPATGVMTFVPFVAVSAEREQFMGFDLSAVQPAATLEHLGASMSKNPLGFVAADLKGVRAA